MPFPYFHVADPRVAPVAASEPRFPAPPSQFGGTFTFGTDRLARSPQRCFRLGDPD